MQPPAAELHVCLGGQWRSIGASTLANPPRSLGGRQVQIVMRDCALSGVCLVFYIIWVLYFAYLEPDFSMLRISDSFSPTTVYVSVMLQTPQKRHSKHTDFALVPVHHQWSLERVPIRLEPPQCVSLIASSADDFASGTGSSEILQDALQLVAGGGCFCNLELEFVPLGLVVLLVAWETDCALACLTRVRTRVEAWLEGLWKSVTTFFAPCCNTSQCELCGLNGRVNYLAKDSLEHDGGSLVVARIEYNRDLTEDWCWSSDSSDDGADVTSIAWLQLVPEAQR
jgi:hypothetical protein